MIKIPLVIWDDKSIATTVNETFEIMVDELNKIQFQLDTAGDKSDLDSVILNLFKEGQQIVGDVPMSDLREIDLSGEGHAPDDTHTFFELDLGAYHLGGEKVYGNIYNGDASTQTVDLQVIADLGLKPKELTYRKYTSLSFGLDNCIALYFHGSALDESDETLSLKIGNLNRDIKLKNFYINHACETGVELIDLTFFAFFASQQAYDVQIITTADLSSNYLVAVTLADLGSPSQVIMKKDRAGRSAQRAIAIMSKRNIETNIHAGTLPAQVKTLHNKIVGQ